MNNRITELREARGFSSRKLAKMVGVSPSQMGRLEKSTRGLSLEWLLRISKALDVSPNELVDIDLGSPIPASCDQALLGTTISFVFKACEEFKIKPTEKDLAGWISFVYDNAARNHMTFGKIQELASTIVKVSKKEEKKPPFDLDDTEAQPARRLRVASAG